MKRKAGLNYFYYGLAFCTQARISQDNNLNQKVSPIVNGTLLIINAGIVTLN